MVNGPPYRHFYQRDLVERIRRSDPVSHIRRGWPECSPVGFILFLETTFCLPMAVVAAIVAVTISPRISLIR